MTSVTPGSHQPSDYTGDGPLTNLRVLQKIMPPEGDPRWGLIFQRAYHRWDPKNSWRVPKLLRNYTADENVFVWWYNFVRRHNLSRLEIQWCLGTDPLDEHNQICNCKCGCGMRGPNPQYSGNIHVGRTGNPPGAECALCCRVVCERCTTSHQGEFFCHKCRLEAGPRSSASSSQAEQPLRN